MYHEPGSTAHVRRQVNWFTLDPLDAARLISTRMAIRCSRANQNHKTESGVPSNHRKRDSRHKRDTGIPTRIPYRTISVLIAESTNRETDRSLRYQSSPA